MQNKGSSTVQLQYAANGQILRDGIEVRKKWAEYFEQVLNVANVREANINRVGNWQMLVLGDLIERAISPSCGMGVRIQPMPALRHVKRGYCVRV